MDCCGSNNSLSADIAHVISEIDQIRRNASRRDELVSYLSERSPVYLGLGSRQAERLRGYIFASFEMLGLPPAAVKHVIEEVETGQDAYSVAGAAIALRGSADRDDRLCVLLKRAADRLATRDEYVRYDKFDMVIGNEANRTALQEIRQTIALLENLEKSHLQPEQTGTATCCSPYPGQVSSGSDADPQNALMNCVLEDQSGKRFPFREFFLGRPSVLTFFYTRCMNPERCSLTISKLARLQRVIKQRERSRDINVAALTYDPAFDSADRLRAYGLDRAMMYDDRNKLLRTIEGLDAVRSQFELNVSYGPSTVNRHGIELLVLDRSARLEQEFRRLKWDESSVADTAEALL